VAKLAPRIGEELAQGLLNSNQSDESGIYDQRERVAELNEKLRTIDSPEARNLLSVSDCL